MAEEGGDGQEKTEDLPTKNCQSVGGGKSSQISGCKYFHPGGWPGVDVCRPSFVNHGLAVWGRYLALN